MDLMSRLATSGNSSNIALYKAQYEEQKQQTTAVDVENLQLIDRLHTMQSEVSSLKKTIEEKEKEDEEMHRALEDGAVIESSLRGELEQQHIRMEEFELEILNLQKKLQMKNAEDTAGEVHHTLEIQNLEQALKELQTQLAEKTAHLESYEKALKETADKLEGASDESHEQLSNAFEIASSLRKLLEDRENQYATLEGDCRRKEMELGEIQRKLASANSTFSETVEARDLRIQELENMLAEKQAEVNETHQELQELQLELDARDNLVRKLEYDIKLKSDQDCYKTKTFVSSLSSWPVAHCDTSTSLRNNVQSMQLKESMRQVYTQTKAALQRANHEGVDTSYNTSSSLKVQAKPSVHWDATASDDQQGHESPDEEMPSPKNSIGLMEESSYSNLLEKTTQSVSDKNDSDGSSIVVNSLQSYNAPAQDPLQANWESSFALYSHNGPNKSSHSLNDLELERTSEGNGPTKQMSDSTFTVAEESPVAVENLQAEIQRLQARIMSRLRDSPTQCEDTSRGQKPQQGVSSTFLTSLPNLKPK
eukprot:Gb_17695 [translate_table: standard]